jgi:hypothetical protein
MLPPPPPRIRYRPTYETSLPSSPEPVRTNLADSGPQAFMHLACAFICQRFVRAL